MTTVAQHFHGAACDAASIVSPVAVPSAVATNTFATDPLGFAYASTANHNGGVFSVAFSPDGKTMITAGWDRKVIVWNVANPAAPSR